MSQSIERQIENHILAAKAEYDKRLKIRRATLTRSQQTETWNAFIAEIAPAVAHLMRYRDWMRTGKRVVYDD